MKHQSLTALVQELHTLRDYIRWTLSQFNKHQVYFGHGTDNPWDEAVQLVLGAVHLPWNTDASLLDARLTQEERERIVQLIRRRCEERMPLPYLLGEAWFAGLPFNVDPRVLIPRSPIGELIQEGFQPWLTEPPQRILDLCTGSGCIGIACAHAFSGAQVDLSDISTDALAVAQTNIERHGLSTRVRALHADLFAGLDGQKYDLIVSNPPYVDTHDLATMPMEYQQEPELALAAGEDGLDLVRIILAQAGQHLTETGLLIVEVGNSESHLEAAYPEVPFLWLEFAEGGQGVFLLTAEQVRTYQADFIQGAKG
ncbi:ribosomal protein L3 glutamine methyltransferase [Allopseudospirillum japonicum]|uniref:Ribosomal protein uL3 glutamine methyltransferase n=1 Tax=Allopseudospirillum japonicum TaxID=64971 RepID=A0A1H6QSV6_9GAMM|nr:50S ribosomal protein L3 N(5)-glutamine methyltransferase [Allopseudospirillum japonicum]SEI42570.1 ribosomal protein L3 glutamine methyltransferase [Allopseudospirillum japonicum]